MFYQGALRAIKNRLANMDMLIALGITIIYLYSSYLLFTRTQPKLYFECSALLLTLILLGKYFETLAKGARAITEFLQENVMMEPLCTDTFTAVLGSGVEGIIKGRKVLIGNLALMEQNGIDTESALTHYESALEKGNSMVFGTVDGSLVALFAVCDTLREDAVEVVKELKTMGLDIWMLTGD